MKFCFHDFSTEKSSKLEILVPTPQNTLVIMWGWDKNFWVSMIFQLINRENKISLSEFFFDSPFKSMVYGYTRVRKVQPSNLWPSQRKANNIFVNPSKDWKSENLFKMAKLHILKGDQYNWPFMLLIAPKLLVRLSSNFCYVKYVWHL